MEKIVYFCFLGAICLSVCGVVTMATNNDNATPINETIKPAPENKTVPEEEEIIEEPAPAQAPDPQAAMEYREREKLENQIVSGEEDTPEEEEETIEEPAPAPEIQQTQIPETTKPVKPQVQAPAKETIFNKKVGKDGYVFLGKEYAGRQAEIKIK